MGQADRPAARPDRRASTEQVFAREYRRSRNVRRLKIALPVIAALAVLGVAGKSAVETYTGVSISLTESTIRDGKLIMANPRMGGVNAGKREYEMTAARAIQDMSNTEELDLEEIGARLPIGAADWATVTAATGTLYKARNSLEIDSPVLVETTDGLTARLLSAVIDMAQGDLSSDDPVEIVIGDSNLTADSLLVTEGGEKLVFERKVKVVIEAGRVNTAAAGGGNGNARN